VDRAFKDVAQTDPDVQSSGDEHVVSLNGTQQALEHAMFIVLDPYEEPDLMSKPAAAKLDAGDILNGCERLPGPSSSDCRG